MSININKVGVLGAGIMGASIAAHIVGAGIPVVLLDIVPNGLTKEEKKKGLTIDSYDYRNRFSLAGKKKVSNPKFKAIFDIELASMIEIGNLSDDLEKLKECDWIIEVVLENIDVKQDLMKKIQEYIKPNAIISSNTSGVSINEIIKGMPINLKERFLGTHFFNPPRYMKLFEIIPADETRQEVINDMTEFATRKLGKGVVYANDTPNFVANRIGVGSFVSVMQLTEKYGFSINKADILTGAIIGRPNTATFKTSDLVGNDILVNVANNVINHTKDEKDIEGYKLPIYVTEMVNNGALGDKVGFGFYKKEKTKNGIKKMVWNYKEKEYQEVIPEKIEIDSEAKKNKCVGEKIKEIINGSTEENKFVWEVIKSNILYSANKVPEIVDNYQYKQIDNGMKWGFNWELGPFEIWDAIGVRDSIKRMKQEGEIIPEWVEKRLTEGKEKFYEKGLDEVSFIRLSDSKYKSIKENKGAVLKDIGDKIACLEFKTKSNTVTEDVMDMMFEAVEFIEKSDYKGLIIANQSKNFSAGANLVLVSQVSKEKKWDVLNGMIEKFQYANLAIKYCKKPIVTAAHGMTLGGGAEIAMHGYKQVANTETYMGLVEIGVGLIPGGGGSKELLWQAMEGLEKISIAERINHVKNIWTTITNAKVSSSAHDAKKLGLLRETDEINMNSDYQVKEAKNAAIALANGCFRPKTKKDIIVTGNTGRAAIQATISFMKDGEFISEYDAFLLEKIAFVLTGGNVLPGTLVSEEYILEIEREIFLDLCKETKTLERIEYMLKKGKPLKN